MHSDLQDKICLITGGGAGIGLATAELMAQRGAVVVLADINEKAGLAAQQQLTSNGHRAYFHATDVSDLNQIQQLFQEIQGEHGQLDIAVNNAGVGGDWSLTHEYDHASWRSVMAINIDAVFHCMQEELRIMLNQENGGVIVNVASMAGKLPQVKSSAYVASKHAVIGLTKTAAHEYARKNIRINAVCPCYTDTQMVSDLTQGSAGIKEKLERAIPMSRLARPDEIANAIGFLASDQSSFSTGLCLSIDGGLAR